MHVGISLLTLVPGQMGGSESYVRALLDQFARGNGPQRVTLLVSDRVAEAYREYAKGPVSFEAIRTSVAGRPAPLRAASIVASLALPRRIPADLDLLHFPVTVPVPRTRLPQVVTLYDIQHHDLPSFFSAPERGLRRLTYDGAARRAAAVITSSEYSRRRISEVLDVPPGRVRAIPGGIDRHQFNPRPGQDDESVRADLGLERPFVLYPANLWPHKNHDRLIRAFSRVGEPHLELLLTGQTHGGARKVTGNRVRHLGYVRREQMAVLYRSARALVFPSLYEGFGAPPLEAMACGCPVAASTRGSLAEVCAEAALPLDPESVESIASAIERVIGDDELRVTLRAAGIERAGQFSWESAAAQHVAVYRDVASAAHQVS